MTPHIADREPATLSEDYVLEQSRYERLIREERRREGGHLLPSRFC